MAGLSRLASENTFQRYSCKQLLHPWSDSCIDGGLQMAMSCSIGCLKFFSIMYSVQLLAKIYAKKNIKFKQELKGFLRSVILGVLSGTELVSLNCLFRKILGKYNHYIFAFLVPLACGLPIFIENPQRRSLNASTFLTMAFEGFYNQIKSQGLVRPTKLGETLVFMLVNGLLMCQLRKQTVLGNSRNTSWFFMPPSFRGEECTHEESKSNHCAHLLNCIDSLKKELIKFGALSILVSFAKLIALNVKTPSRILTKAFKWKRFQLTAFVISYIGLFKVINCLLCKTKGDSLQNTFLAGMAAGLSYTFNPNQTFIFSVLTALTEVCGMQIIKKYRLPNLPYTEISFIFANAYIIYLRMFDRFSCPKYVYGMLNFCSGNKAEIINKFWHKILTEGKNELTVQGFTC